MYTHKVRTLSAGSHPTSTHNTLTPYQGSHIMSFLSLQRNSISTEKHLHGHLFALIGHGNYRFLTEIQPMVSFRNERGATSPRLVTSWKTETVDMQLEHKTYKETGSW